MAARLWQIPSGAITTLLIAVCFDPDQQGIYFLILSLTGLQALADAGLLNTLLHAASHESAHGRFDARNFIRVPRRSLLRLAGITRFALVWFAAASLVLMLVGTIIGSVLLARQNVIQTSIGPLIVAIVLAAMTLALSPMVAILEGCNQVRTVNRYRLGQVMTGSLVVWACLAGGAGLWTAAAAILVQLVWEFWLIASRYRPFFVQLLRQPPGDFDWRREIWPLQWRIGVQSVVQFLAFLPIVPVLFDTQGPVVAGLYGLTWQVLNSLLMVAYAYLRTRSPDFGRLIAEKPSQRSQRQIPNRLDRIDGHARGSADLVLLRSICPPPTRLGLGGAARRAILAVEDLSLAGPGDHSDPSDSVFRHVHPIAEI